MGDIGNFVANIRTTDGQWMSDSATNNPHATFVSVLQYKLTHDPKDVELYYGQDAIDRALSARFEFGEQG